MKKNLYAIILFTLSTTSNADTQFALGLGSPYGGFLGGKYSVNYDHMKIFAGAGLLGASSEAGSALGYSIGFESEIEAQNYSFGLSYGTVEGSIINDEVEAYIGFASNYAYYFSGFNKPSFILGLSFYEGTRAIPNSDWDDDTTGAFVNIGYQF